MGKLLLFKRLNPRQQVTDKSAAYDEEDNGFMFKRTRSKQTEAKAQTESKPAAAIEKAPTAAPLKRKRKSFSSPDIPNTKATQQPRRSKRLSGETVPDPSTPAELKIKRRETVAPKQVTEDSDSPQLIGDDLQVDKNRHGTKIALPFADTPVQNRNKQMREKAAGKQKSRRSSSGIRGRRASSLLDSGNSNGESCMALSTSSNIINTNASNLIALPHADVDTRDFYKHIDQSLPEPHRMRHLLTWCSARALPEKVPGASRTPNESLAIDAGTLLIATHLSSQCADVCRAARHIQEELLKDFASKAEMSDWFARAETPASDPAAAPATLIKKPNPRNVQHAAKLRELDAAIARLQAEKASWERILATAAAAQRSADDTATLDDPALAAALAALQAARARPADLAARLRGVAAALEPAADALADGVHRVAQVRVAAERVAARVLGAAAERVERRETAGRVAAGAAAVGPKDVLAALARVMGGRQGA